MAVDYLDLQYAGFLGQDPLLRSGIPEAVHEMRSATQRLRPFLDIYGGSWTPVPAGTSGMS